MRILFLGNRGSRPIGASENSPFGKYGGDTTCVGVLFDDGTVVSLDAGSGFWKWPYTLQKLAGHNGPYDMHLFLSHFHDDHTMGLAQSPFLFDQKNNISIYGPDFDPGLESIFHSNANRPRNPDLAHKYRAKLSFNKLSTANKADNVITLPNGAKISWLTVPHADEQSLGFRIEHNGCSIAMISDTHHDFAADEKTPVISPEIVDFIRDADALIYDCHFTDAELNDAPFFRTFGHSTGEQGVRLCDAADVPLLVTHHHNPNNDDRRMDDITAALRSYGLGKGVYVIPAKPSLCLDPSMKPEEVMRDAESQSTPEKRWQRIGGVAIK